MLEDWMRDQYLKRGYSLVYTPHVARCDLWKTSGHCGFLRREHVHAHGAGRRRIPAQADELPVPHPDLSRTGSTAIATCRCGWASSARSTATSAPACMHGLLRVRGFTQDDAHIFCTPEQIEDEVVNCLQFAIDTLHDLRLRRVRSRAFHLGRRRERQVRRHAGAVGAGRKRAANAPASGSNIKAKVMPDEAAFYGPKIDVKLVDAIGRLWQLSTVQFDFTLPRRFGLEYIGEDGKAHQPLMVHRALYGSDRALLRHPDRALCRRVPGVAGAGAGDRAADHRPADRYAQQVREAARRGRHPRHAGRSQREGEPEDPRSAVAEDPVHAGGGRPRAGERQVAVRNRKHGDQGVKPVAEFLADIRSS